MPPETVARCSCLFVPDVTWAADPCSVMQDCRNGQEQLSNEAETHMVVEGRLTQLTRADSGLSLMLESCLFN